MASSSNSASACASTSTFTTTADGNNCYQYDVFINHRGPDVKKTFASDLYHLLKANGLRVFLDKEELQKGDELACQIEGAIQTASVHIAIFSINYAHSKWCLDELVLMLESGSTILPIFFGVQPSELRWTEGEKGVYAQALRSLQQKRTSDSLQPRYDSKTIGKWKKALYDVAAIIGFELEEAPYNGNERKLLADVVQRVLEKVPKTPLYVSKYPTGLDDKVRDFEESVLWQQHKTGEARVVGIVGLGGVGKTTLAKEFFNRARANYRRSCFLFDVREYVSRRSLNSLQSILLNDLAQLKDVQINSTDEGIEKLRKHLSSFHALIIFDDVDHLEQLEALISPAKDVLAPSSLILVTSRNKDILTSWGIGDLFIYRLKGLNPQHSTELFCSHAFHHPHPVAGFEQVVTEFLDACNGLPLSLKVLGALLRGKNDLEYWKAQLRKISKILPADIQKTLKVSYDSLDEEEKQIFLDIACFFIGEDKDTAIRIWEGSGWEGSLGFQNLQNKCLVDVEVENKYQLVTEVEGNWIDVELGGKECITMHDHLRDLGRHLAAKETLHRSWRVTNNVLDQSAVREIKNLAECSLVDERRLHMFHGKGYCVDSVFSVGQQLVWLLWNYCPYPCLPSWIPVKNLRVLQIHGSDFKTLWQHESEAPLQLRELHIVTARLVKIPESIGLLKHLQKVVLHPYQIVLHQMHLKTLPDEYGQLQFLKHLELSKCSKMKSLPDSFWYLTNLEHVNLSSCRGLKMLPDSFGNLTKLQHIDLSECKELQMLPSSFRNLIQLKFLSLRECKQLTISKETLGKITTLEYLSLSGCENIKALPPQLTYQRFLRKLHLASDFKELPGAIGDLTNLKILSLGSSCLERLPPSFGYLRSLEDLELYFCPFTCFPECIRMLTQLKKLRISFFENLELLEIKECSSRELRILVSENLEQLEIEECPSREPTFKNVGGEIETVTDSTGEFETATDFRGKGVLGKLDGSEVSYPKAGFPNLQHLQIDQCDRLVEVASLPTTLTKLRLKDCPRLRKIGGLSNLPKLQTLHISCCKELEELPTLETLVSLEVLRAYECVSLKRIQGLAQLRKFQRLYVNGCYELEELPGVENLKTIEVSRCPKLPWSEEEVERLRQRLKGGLIMGKVNHYKQQSQPDVARDMALLFRFVLVGAAVLHGLSLIFT